MATARLSVDVHWGDVSRTAEVTRKRSFDKCLSKVLLSGAKYSASVGCLSGGGAGQNELRRKLLSPLTANVIPPPSKRIRVVNNLKQISLCKAHITFTHTHLWTIFDRSY